MGRLLRSRRKEADEGTSAADSNSSQQKHKERERESGHDTTFAHYFCRLDVKAVAEKDAATKKNTNSKGRESWSLALALAH